MRVDDSVREHNTNLILNAVSNFAKKANIDIKLADAIYDYFCEYYYHFHDLTKEHRRMMRLARKHNLTWDDCNKLFRENT